MGMVLVKLPMVHRGCFLPVAAYTYDVSKFIFTILYVIGVRLW